MSKNDVTALKLEYNKWLEVRADGLADDLDPFEFFCAEHFLKDFNLSDQDIAAGIVGKSLDGGCDGFFFLIGGRFIDEDTPIPEQRGMTVNLIFLQAKQGDGFSHLSVDRFDALTDDILDIPRPPSQHRRTYHEKLLQKIAVFKSAYQKLVAPRLVIDYYYVTCVDATEDQDCRNSADHVVQTVKGHFNRADVHPFHFINAAKFYTQVFERPSFSKKLQFVDLIDGTQGWIGLVRLRDFYAFLKGDDGELIERIFDDNVRGFQLDTRVNESIHETLTNSSEKPEFWLLNNGITILSPDAESEGGKMFRISDPQIVNGLQTSRQIFNYFKAGSGVPTEDNRRIVIRVIENQDEKTREEIIRATNNQNPMPAEALYTTTRIHKQIEGLFASNGLYYERRKGYWRDQKKPISRIVSAVSVVQAVVAIMLHRPDVARGRPRDYINDDQKRYSIFGHDDYDDSKPMPLEISKARPYDLEVYLQCIKIVRRVDKFLDSRVPKLDSEGKRNLLYYLTRCVACAATKDAYCPPAKVLKIDVSALTDDFIKNSGFARVKRIYRSWGGNDEAGKNPKMGDALNKWLIKQYSPPHK